MSQIVQFLILPYVNFRQDFTFYEFQAWQNTPENWKKHLGIDNTKFLERFLDNKGLPLKHNIYIISTKSLYVPYQMWERLIHILFFLVFGFPKVTADNFYFEIWEWDKKSPREGYIKHDKFSKTIVAPKTIVRIYSDQYVHLNLLISIDPSSSTYDYFQNLFRTDYNSPILRSISYFFKTQYRNVAHFSSLEDIVNFCSAFQTFLEIDDRRDLGKIIGQKLANSFDIEDKTKEKIKVWMDKFYSIRSRYTHGDTIKTEELVYNNIRHIDIAYQVFQALLMRKHSIGLEYLIDAPIVDLFDSQENFECLIDLLSRNHAKEFIFNCGERELKKIRNLFFDIQLNNNTAYIHYDKKNRLKRALNTIISMCGQLCREYLGNKEKEKVYYIKPLEKIQSILDNEKTFEQKIDKFPQASVDATELNQTLKEIKLREVIPLGHILETFGMIVEIYERKIV